MSILKFDNLTQTGEIRSPLRLFCTFIYLLFPQRYLVTSVLQRYLVTSGSFDFEVRMEE